MSETEYITRCPDCGRQIATHHLDEHRASADCQRRTFDGECPICGQEYESYTRHLSEGCAGPSRGS